MYSPKISEHLIPTLYQEARKQGKPMTTIVNDILEEYFIESNEKENGVQSDSRQGQGYRSGTIGQEKA